MNQGRFGQFFRWVFSALALATTIRITQVVGHAFQKQEVSGSKPNSPIPKELKIVPVVALLGAQGLASLLSLINITEVTQLTLRYN